MYPRTSRYSKTSVIAEIAMQMTQRGKRVLISSQTNLAVDNALERLAKQTDIFPVRLGRIEAVKLDPILHIDTASKRYKSLLLSRSSAAEKRMLSQVEGSDDLPTESEFENWLQARLSLTRLKVQAQALQNDLQLNGSRFDEAKTATADAAARRSEVCAHAGLTEGQVSAFLTVVNKLAEQQIALAVLAEERLKIKTVLARKPAVNALLSQADKLATMGKTARATDQDVTRYTVRLGKSALRKTELEEARRFNDALQRKRAKGWLLGRTLVRPHRIIKRPCSA